MKAEIRDIIAYLYSFAPELGDCCDRCTWDGGNKAAGKIAVTCFPSVNSLRSAADWGAELMITHEPLFYNHSDVFSDNLVSNEKKRLLTESKMTVWRWHDHAHAAVPDAINEGIRTVLGSGEYEERDIGLYRPARRYKLDTPLTAREILRRIGNQGNIVGCADKPMSRLSLCCGFAQEQTIKCEIASGEVDAVIAGETLQWNAAEYVRDAYQLGYELALILGGHSVTEEFGMKLLSERLKTKFPECEVKFFSSGAPFTL